MKFWKKLLLSVLGFFIFIILWTLYAFYLETSDDASHQFIPYPSRIVTVGYELLFSKKFWVALTHSNGRVLAAFSLSIVLGVPIGICFGWWKTLRNILGASFNFGRYLPVAALVPLSIVILGVSDFQKITVLFLGTVFHVIVMIEDSVQRIPDSYIATAKTMGFSKIKIAKKVVLPSISVAAYDSARVAMGLCWSYLMVAEIVASEKGIGYLIIRAQRFLQIEELYFFIFILGLIGLIFDQIFIFFKPKLFPWLKEQL